MYVQHPDVDVDVAAAAADGTALAAAAGTIVLEATGGTPAVSCIAR